jgi:DNA-binding transcriptional LysR family regulator
VDADERRRIEHDCRNLVMAVAQHGDHLRLADAAAQFAEDGTWQRGGKAWQGREAVAASYAVLPATQVTRHMSANSLITILDPDHAEGVTYYVAYHHDPGTPDPTFPLPFDEPFSLGEWHDRFVRTAEGWRISHRETRRLFQRRGGH